ncbi:SMP-30/gluconolactonase/LRE family protein [Sorangium sp. So ce1182]|uniref:SMP-30/gluconolactonase/LRE family protein n=1 Tax=Sorangium sp. So ce1182 TaxID=3133334 RepID=UPI003F5EF2CC
MLWRIVSAAALGCSAAALGCGDGGEAPASSSDGGGGPGGSTGTEGATVVSGSTGASGGSGSAGTGGSGAAGSGGSGVATSGSAGSGGGGGGGGGAGGGGGGASTICPGGPYAANPLPAGRPQRVRDGFEYVEGPVWVAEQGALFFSEIHLMAENAPPLNGPKATIHRFVPPSSFEVFIGDSSANGLGLHVDGNLIACTHDTRSVSVFDLGTKARRLVAERYMGKRFNSPNDVVVRGDGNVYFSDPDFQLSGRSELPMAVYRVSPSGDVSVVDTMDSPNGVALSPDGSALYAGEFGGPVWRYPLSADGSAGSAPELVANLVDADGMGVDCAGNLYVGWEGGVEVIAPSGEKLGTIEGTGKASNVAFGGADRKTLYITAGPALYAVEMPVPGYPN